jgi:hypothetical protein
MIKSMRVEMARTCSTHGRRDVYRILVGKPGGKKSLGRPGVRWEDNPETWMIRALLRNGQVKTPRQNTHKATIVESPFLCNDL